MDGDKIQTVQGTDVVIHKTNGNSALWSDYGTSSTITIFSVKTLILFVFFYFSKYIQWLSFWGVFSFNNFHIFSFTWSIYYKFLVYYENQTVLKERLIVCAYEEYGYATVLPEYTEIYYSIIIWTFRRGDGGECQGYTSGHQGH